MFMSKKIIGLLLTAVYFIVAYAVFNYYNINCVFLEYIGLPCPGCGMTRALISVIKFDFYNAAKYNIVIFFMPYVFAYLLFDFKHKIHKLLLMAIAVIAIVNWLIKINIFF